MKKLALGGAVVCLFLSVAAANASPIQNITFTGNLSSGQDNSKMFGLGTNIAGDAYSITLSYNPSAFTGDSCGSATTANFCTFTLGAGGLTEAITINSITQTFTAATGTIAFGTGGGDTIQVQGSNGVTFSAGLTDSTSLFSSQSDVNNPELLLNVTNLALSSGSFNTSNGGPLSIGGSPSRITTSLVTSVPEPITLSLFGAGLAGAAAIRRRRKTKKA
jgi:hypothetical protein